MDNRTLNGCLCQETVGWQWHQLDHMRITCTLLQTNNHASTSSPCVFSGETLYVPDSTHTSYLIIRVTYINTPLSLVLIMSLHSLHMLTTVLSCLHALLFFFNSVYQMFISYVLMCACCILIKIYLLAYNQNTSFGDENRRGRL